MNSLVADAPTGGVEYPGRHVPAPNEKHSGDVDFASLTFASLLGSLSATHTSLFAPSNPHFHAPKISSGGGAMAEILTGW